MTVVNPKSISGITSITTASGSDNLLTIHTSDASNTERFRIDSTGTTKIVTGIVTTLTATTGIATDFTANKITLPDSSAGSINVGLGSDLVIYHDGSNSFIKNSTGNLRIQDANGNIQIQAKAGEESIIAKTDGAVELYYDNSKKLDTVSEGISVTGTVKINNTSSVGDYNGGADDMLIGTHSGNHGMTILSGTSNGGYIMFSDNNGGGTNAYRGQIEYAHSSDYMRFITSSTERMRIRGWGDVNISNKLNVAGITTTTALTVNGGTTPATITHTGGNALHLTRSSKTLGFNANYGAGDVKSQIDVSSGMGLALAVADNEKIRMTSGGNFNIGGDYAQTSSQLYIKGGTGGGGNFNGLEIKHSNTNSSAGAGDGPAILLNGYYSSAEWQFAKICSVNSGSGFGADFQVHVHPSAGSQGASLVKAVTIVGNGSNAGNTKVLGSLAIGQHASSSISNNFPGSALVQTGMYICAYNGDNLITNASQGGGSSTLYIGNQAIQTSSDKRIKKNIVDTTSNVLDKIKQVRVVDFDWDDPSDTASVNRNSRGKWTGCLAQEMVDIFPHVINAPRKEDNSLDYDSDRTWLVDYGHLVPTLIKGMQELSAENTALKSRLDAAGL